MALERLLAREQERSRRLDLRLAHARVAARLLTARRSESSYISHWRAMLAGPVDNVARSLLEPDKWTDALFQTTPWAFALERPRSRRARSVP
jgi:hypothetical protein